MKNYTNIFVAIISMITLSCFAQPSKNTPSNRNMDDTQLMYDMMPENGLDIVSYHVEERINMQFGSRITTYNVSSLAMVSKIDLGPNNSRVVTPIYGKLKLRSALSTIAASGLNQSFSMSLQTISLPVIPIKILAIPSKIIDPVAVDVRPKSVDINILSTYERIVDKGYRSVDMLKRVANGRFFDGDLTIAAKYYTILFDTTTDLEPVYYYRYATSLSSIGQHEKAKSMMKIFQRKDL